MDRTTAALALAGGVLLLAAACSDSDQDPGGDAGVPNCPTGTKVFKTACVPVFDTCKKDEVSVPGGGCKKVGVEECKDGITGLTGLKAGPDWKCKPIGPPTTCLTGWQKVSGGWCEPLYAADKCPAGSMAVSGKSTCQPIGDCGTGTWGKITTTAATLHVNGAYAGGGSDGSQSKPFTTIAAALAKVGTGGHVAVAAGTYNEDLTITASGVTLEGVCAKRVTVKGQTAKQAVEVKGPKVTVRGLTVTGPDRGILVYALVDGAIIERVAVLDTGVLGLELYSATTVRDCLVQGAGSVGIYVMRALGSSQLPLILQRVTIRDTVPVVGGLIASANGLYMGPHVKADISHSLLLANTCYGLVNAGGELALTRSAVAATKEDLTLKNSKGEKAPNGQGIVMSAITLQGESTIHRPRATLRDCLIKENRSRGISVEGGGTLRVERSVIRDTKPSAQLADGKVGFGIGTNAATSPSIPSSVTVSDSLISDNYSAGIALSDSLGVVERSLVRDTGPTKWTSSLVAGMGVSVAGATGRLTMKDSLVSGNSFAGVYVGGSTAQLDRVVIRDTLPGAIGLIKPGYGIFAASPSSMKSRPRLTLRDCALSGNKVQNLCLVGADATVERSLLRGSGNPSATADGATVGVLAYRWSSKASDVTDVKLTETVVVDHQLYGVQSVGATVTLKRSVVRDTHYAKEAGKGGGYGLGGVQGSLVLEESLVSGNHTAGVLVSGSGTSLELRRSAVVNTQKSLDGYGDGVLASNGATMKLSDSLVDQSARVGLLFDGTGGKVSRSLLRSAVVGVALKDGAAPTIDKDVVFSNTKEDRTTTSTMQVAQPPAVPPPPSLPGS